MFATAQATTRSDMIDTNAFTKLVPGFDFLQNLMQGAGQAVPAMGQWIAPTLNPEELEKRIGELKTVQFWLEQNARMIGMTVQALEVQRMTLSTLQTMNLPMADLRSALTLPTAAPAAAPAPPAAAPPAAPAAAASQPPGAESAAKPAGVDPMQWWGALTQQFTEIATKAMHDSSAIASRNLAAAAAAKEAAKPPPKAAAAKTAPPKAATKAPRKRA
jgi:pyruvate/2-oxoglutarate dehydrogenase complex dihydrolipoamide acyltransferase (E2) component